MIVVDVNLLIYAHARDHPLHDPARTWWEEALSGRRSVGLCAPVVFAFVRLMTNRRVVSAPVSVGEAAGRVVEWLDQPVVSYLGTTSRHLTTALALLEQVGTAGNLTTDAQIAAHALAVDGEVHSHDTDFARFRDLRWVDPLR